MKKFVFILLFSVSYILSQNVSVEQNKWYLGGATQSIDVIKNVSKNCSMFVFDYASQKFTPYKGVQATSDIKMIEVGVGFWALGIGGSCQIDTDKDYTGEKTSSGSSNPNAQVSETATYELTFHAIWSSSTHPKGFPSNPHFSPLIGMLSTQDNHLYTRGEVASAGMKLMSETGAISTLQREIQAIDNALMVRGTVMSSPGSTKVTFEANSQRSFLSLVSMIAPSPDWFVAVNAMSLKDESGKWLEEATVNLKLYDAGTDSGTSFSSANQATSPQAGITLLSETAVDFAEGKPFVGAFMLKKTN